MLAGIANIFVLTLVLAVFVGADYDPFADTILHSINWPGPIQDISDASSELLSEPESLVLTTNNNEKYRCIMPNTASDKPEADDEVYTGPTEMELMSPLFSQSTCSYRIESYWTYELCHGKHLRQYHEEKELAKVKPNIQEYFLGRAVPSQSDAGTDSETQIPPPDTQQPLSIKEARKKVPLQKVEGIEIPYYKVQFEDGTKCDLTGEPRRTSLHYVCQPEGKGVIYELKETSTCEYEVIVLTKHLCDHPYYKQKKETVSKIQCHSLEGSPTRPKNLDSLELENSAGRYNKKEFWEDFEDDESVSGGLPQKDVTHEQRQVEVKIQEKQPAPSTIGSGTDKQLLRDFLNGEYCLTGGSGWWKHEFCYGKSVTQFHEDKGGARTNIILGIWDKEDHLSYLKLNPSKKPKSVDTRRHILNYYSTGDVCEITNKRRFTEVKLKCKENSSQPHAVALYLVEPEVCEYLLVVESPIFCPLILQADEYGLLENPEL